MFIILKFELLSWIFPGRFESPFFAKIVRSRATLAVGDWCRIVFIPILLEYWKIFSYLIKIIEWHLNPHMETSVKPFRLQSIIFKVVIQNQKCIRSSLLRIRKKYYTIRHSHNQVESNDLLFVKIRKTVYATENAKKIVIHTHIHSKNITFRRQSDKK